MSAKHWHITGKGEILKPTSVTIGNITGNSGNIVGANYGKLNLIITNNGCDRPTTDTRTDVKGSEMEERLILLKTARLIGECVSRLSDNMISVLNEIAIKLTYQEAGRPER